MIQDTPGYQAILRHYGDRRATRSGVLLIDHINQGLVILDRIGSDNVVKEAYAVHPIFQADDDLKEHFFQSVDLHPLVVLYAMEYRNIANGFLSEKIVMPVPTSAMSIFNTGPKPLHPIKISPLSAVNKMLIADKVQNRKDFDRYHKGLHDRSDELDFYFKHWLQELDISEDRYQELIEGL